MNSKDNLLVSISRLIVVDSVGVAIAEIDLREGGILIGGGNIGKTSILNAIRLFLLAEENFKNSKNKFGFSDKEGKFYSDDDCYHHYFPSHRSFLILECDNYFGTALPHCQILFRGSQDKLDYKRMFTSLAYEKIRHLFWDSTFGEDGIGGAVEDLSPTKVQKYLKQADPHFKMITRSSAIKEIIYANNFIEQDSMRFCLFPLHNTTDAEINSFRSLVRLLFDMRTGSDAVRLAVANLIESQKKEQKDILDFNITQFIEHNDSLKRREELLNNIQNLKPEFDDLRKQYELLQNNTKAEEQLMQFALMVNQKLDTEKKDYQAENTYLNLIQEKKKPYENSIKQLKTEIIEITGIVKFAKNEIIDLEKKISDTKLVIRQYGEDLTHEEIIAEHQQLKSKKVKERELRNDIEKRKIEIDTFKTKIEDDKRLHKILENAIINKAFSIENQIHSDAYLTLLSVNEKFSEVNPQRDFSSDEIASIEQFTKLFEYNKSFYNFFGAEFNGFDFNLRESIDTKLENTKKRIFEHEAQLSQLKNMNNESKLTEYQNIEAIGREIKRLERELILLESYNVNQQRLDEQLNQVEGYLTKQSEINEKVASIQTKLDGYQSEFNQQNEKLINIRQQIETTDGLRKDINAQLSAHHLPTENFSVLPDPSVKLDHENLKIRVQALFNKRNARTSVVEKIHHFIQAGVLENDDELRSAYVEDEKLNYAYHQLHSRYQDLEKEFDILRGNYRELKHTIHGIIHELKNNRDLVRQFEQAINRAFADIRINDLDGVQASIHLEKRFEALVAEIEILDAHSDQQAPEQFIQRLKSFGDNFFPNGKTALLTMDQVIAGISYRVKKNGKNHWDTKSQSTSTIMLINIKLVEILLNQIRHKACRTHFPLIIDEGASVDSSQFDWLLPNMKASGFRVLSASTNSASSEIIFKFGQHFRLDAMRTARPYDESRTIAFTGMPDYFISQETPFTSEQLDFLEMSDV